MSKNKLYFLVSVTLIVSIALPISLENKPDVNIFGDLKRGERVTVILKSDISYTGVIKSIINDKIELDISYDDPILKGSFSFHSRDIKSIVSRTMLSKIEKDRIAAEKEKMERERQRLMPQTSFSSENAQPTEQSKSKEKTEEENLLDLLSRFPRGDTWNSKTFQEIKDKNDFLRTAEETAFMENYPNWLKALALKEKVDNMEFFRRYLPEDGWGEEKYTDLITRYIRFKIGLTPEEQEFVDKYELWKRTKPLYEEEQKKIREQQEEKSKPTPSPEQEE